MSNAIKIMQYSAVTDVQANRLLFILKSFRSVVEDQEARSVAKNLRARSIHFDFSEGNIADPLGELARAQQTFLDQQTMRARTGPAADPVSIGAIHGHNLVLETQALVPKLNTIRSGDLMSTAMVSPVSSRADSSHSRTDHSTEKFEPLGEHEFDLNSLWNLQTPLDPLDSVNFMHHADAGPPSASSEMQMPSVGLEPSRHEFMEHARFRVTNSDSQVEHLLSGTSPAVPLFSLVEVAPS